MKGQKLFVVSDIHGHYSIMVEALKKAGFDRNDPTHILICCGDYFDRGRENAQVLSFFERLERKILLRGNHEDMLLKLLQTGKKPEELEESELREIVRFACTAAGLSTTRSGGISSVPEYPEVLKCL